MILRSETRKFLTAVQFLTRIPVPGESTDSLPRAAIYFPMVGTMIGLVAAAIHFALVPHLTRVLAAFFTVAGTVLLTGALHEDAVADAADGFGGGWTRDRILAIMRDSRIGSYGAAALIVSLVGRIALIAALPLGSVTPYLIAAHALSRWTALPLSSWLPPARTDQEGLGIRLAQLTTRPALIAATLYTFVAASCLLRMRSIAAILSVITVTSLTGLYYRQRIHGITGDCLGATNQLAEMTVYLCGAWLP